MWLFIGFAACLFIGLHFARVSYSPLVTDIRGSVKDTTFSKWKSTNYIRARVTPSNPNTAAQQAVRESMARCVSLYQSMASEITDAWNAYAVPYNYSGYNAMVKADRVDEQVGDPILFTPVNPDIVEITDLAASTGSGSKEIDLTWTDPEMGAGYYVYVAAREDGEDEFIEIEKETTLASAESLTITLPKASTTYDIFVSVEKTADNDFSKSDVDSADSHA